MSQATDQAAAAERSTDGGLYQLETVDESVLKKLVPIFDSLEADPYCEGGYRFRGYTLYFFEGDKLVRQPSHPFYQSASINRLWGDLERNFGELSKEDEATTLDTLTDLSFRFCRAWNLDPEGLEVGVHPIRTLCVEGHAGHPAPEGIHSDGFVRSSILVVQRENVTGGETRLYRARDESQRFFAQVLEEGQWLTFDDSTIFHYTTPVAPAGTGRSLRDVLILCIARRGAHQERAAARN